jgi:peptide/nickel transport system substrate-binding protein
MLMSLCLAGCGGTTPASTVQPSSSAEAPSASSAAKKSDRTDLNIVLSGAIATAAPQGTTKNTSVQLYQWVYEGLIFVTDQNVVEPRIADSWKQSEDGKSYTFHIRNDITFHNGDPLTVEDVVFSLNRGISMSFMSNFVGGWIEAKATGDWEVTVTLEAPDSSFLVNLYQVKIISKAVCEKLGDKFGQDCDYAGTGPYMITAYDPAALVKLTRYDGYYRETKGNIKDVNVHIITNASTRVTALQTGELDFIDVPAANWAAISSDSKFTSTVQDSAQICTLIVKWYDEASPLHDQKVRQALRFALDTATINKVAAGGLGTPAAVLCNPKYVQGSSDMGLTTNFTYDVAKAKALLAEAGYPDGFTLDECFLVPNTYENEAVATIVQSYWAAVGVKIDIKVVDSTSGSAQSKAGEMDVYITNSNMVYKTSTIERATHSRTVSTQVAKYMNPEFDSYMDNAKAALTEKEMVEWYAKANNLLNELSIHMPLYYMNKPYAWNKDLNATTGVYYLYVEDWSWM